MQWAGAEAMTEDEQQMIEKKTPTKKRKKVPAKAAEILPSCGSKLIVAAACLAC